MGNKSGIIEGGLWVFKKKSVHEYQEKRNSDNFLRFEKVIGLLSESSVKVINNMSYYFIKTKKYPTCHTKKMRYWTVLKRKPRAFIEDMVNIELMKLVNEC